MISYTTLWHVIQVIQEGCRTCDSVSKSIICISIWSSIDVDVLLSLYIYRFNVSVSTVLHLVVSTRGIGAPFRWRLQRRSSPTSQTGRSLYGTAAMTTTSSRSRSSWMGCGTCALSMTRVRFHHAHRYIHKKTFIHHHQQPTFVHCLDIRVPRPSPQWSRWESNPRPLDATLNT